MAVQNFLKLVKKISAVNGKLKTMPENKPYRCIACGKPTEEEDSYCPLCEEKADRDDS